jgi:LysM repeat protein
VELADGRIVTVLPGSGGIENSGDAVFTTTVNGQTGALFKIYCRPERRGSWYFLRKLMVNGIPPATAGEPELRMTVKRAAAGSFRMSIRESVSGLWSGELSLAGGFFQHLGFQHPASGGVEAPIAVRTIVESPPSAAGKRARSRLLLFAVPGLCALGTAAYLLFGQAVFPGTVQEKKSVASPTQGGEKRQEAQAKEPPVIVREKSRRTDENVRAYRINRGDTMWEISDRFYGDPWLYPSLASYNHIVNPDLIVTGDSLELPPRLAERGRR